MRATLGSSTKHLRKRPIKGSKATQEFPEFCPRYRWAIELIGRKWTGAIIRSLLKGPRRFHEILETVPGLSERVLSERLRELVEEGLATRKVAAGPPLQVSYGLTTSGESLVPVIRTIGQWADCWVE